MRKICWALLVFCIPLGILSQKEESAELFLEEYTDEFQSLFFEALKQKGIQNYDRAVEKLLECKNLQPENEVVDYELARAYYLDGKYNLAQGYAVLALEKAPNNYWYLEHFVSIMDRQGNTIDAFADILPLSNTILKENLANIYFQKRKYEEALRLLANLPETTSTNSLKQKIEDSLQRNEVRKTQIVEKATISESPVESFRKRIAVLISNSDFNTLQKVAKEAMDSYPLQPYFQYGYGLALTKTNKQEKGIEVLEAAVDFIFDDDSLKNSIYKVLSDTFASMGNQKKANEYSSKIVPGS
ncbi:tetratricopeptide repeat protein [Flagellimonas sp.]|uniref:tetratricopeptide repeat protein n=1 Tax=Flagellimonas sp. TaxID=2058762 RepID=UPI003F4A746B